MEHHDLNNMTGGWFMGNFAPSAFKTDTCEAAVKEYKAGDKEDWHYHKVATEITLILKGTVRMCDQIFEQGSIITLEPGEGTSFEAITDATTVVVKCPCVKNDKYRS